MTVDLNFNRFTHKQNVNTYIDIRNNYYQNDDGFWPMVSVHCSKYLIKPNTFNSPCQFRIQSCALPLYSNSLLSCGKVNTIILKVRYNKK